MESNTPLSEQYLEAATEWVDAEAAASLLEDTKSSVMSQKMLACGDIAVNKAEMLVKGSREWMDHLGKINQARTHANRLKIKLDYLKMRHSEWQSEEANNRTQARL
jgi:hypothetical protein